MNRKQRREFIRKAKRKGIDEETAKVYLAVKEMPPEKRAELANSFECPIKAGDKVTLNINSIKEDVNWQNKTERYKAFVEENATAVFTVENTTKAIVFLEGCDWAFYYGDLDIIEEAEVAIQEENHGD